MDRTACILFHQVRSRVWFGLSRGPHRAFVDVDLHHQGAERLKELYEPPQFSCPTSYYPLSLSLSPITCFSSLRASLLLSSTAAAPTNQQQTFH